MKVFATILAALGLLLLTPVSAQASPTCEYRSAAHIAEHGGFAADNAWHIAHGDLPTCDPEPEQGSVQPSTDNYQDRDDDGRKSRFCRKHWFC
ncbi:RDF protein [Mycobacterium phage Phantastic]|uniref:RDF protein n=1 Tax=Mycobacterium phage Phantastic TaxID=1486426 RepID=A0A023W7T1_9CAUD|nr:site-specific recombination directionality factor RDF [Mycobacterium phage Phantastic]AHY27143.1 RDF protein [Mycobacterium phage Phantastic]